MSLRAITAALMLMAILCVDGLAHVASLLVMPRVAPADAFARLAAAVPEGVVRVLAPAASSADPLQGRDPAVATAVCRYDLDHGPLRVSAALGDAGFLALTLHARNGVAFYGLTDRAANEGRLDIVVMTPAQLEDAKAKDNPDLPARDVRVVAPQDQGFVMLDVLPRFGGPARAGGELASMRCGVEHPV